MTNNNKLKIKSAGFVDGEYKVIFDNDMELEGIFFIDIKKDTDSLGKLKMEVWLEDLNKK